MQKIMLRAITLGMLAVAPAAAQDPPDWRAEMLRARVAARAIARSQEAALIAERVSAAAVSRHALHARTAAMLEQAQRAAHEARAVARALPHAAHYQRAIVEAQLARQLRPDEDDAAFDEALDRLLGDGPPAPWAQQDPADSLYREAREQLNGGEYRAAARLFSRIRREDRFARSKYRAASHYWEAFALSRLGSADDLRAARTVLATMRTQHPDYDRIADADALAATINGRLARMGDARAARNLRSVARQQPQCGEDDDIRAAALNALFQMESANAIPILKEILARRDECSATLRVRAMMMLAQQNTAEAREILIDAALNDPDAEVREQATFWLSQVQDDAAVDALARILAGNATPSVQQKAVFALGQHRSERAAEILRQYAMRSDLSDELERHVVFSLAQSRDPENVAFLRELYQRADDRQVKQQIIVSLASTGIDNGDWLMSVALDENEDMEVRTQALMMASQTARVPTDRIIQLYDRATNEELRKRVLFILSQRAEDDGAAVDKLLDIARNSTDLETRKQAMFWLTQSRPDDPRVTEMLLEIIKR